MDETAFRILDALSSGLGKEISIRSLTDKIARKHGTAHYANIYRRLQEMAKEGTINLTRIGKTIIASINFSNYATVDLLAEMELRKKQAFLKDSIKYRMPFADMEARFSELYLIRSVLAINPYRNARLNRAELLILIGGDTREKETRLIREIMQTIQAKHNVKIDYLILDEARFLDMISRSEVNPVREMIVNKIAFFSPQTFWFVIKTAAERSIPVAMLDSETDPAKIPEQDLMYNLARFGYSELGIKLEQGSEICIEYIVSALLMKGDARRKEAVPVILAKNKASYELLVFLSQKYGFSDRLLGLLKVLARIVSKPDAEAAIRVLEVMKIKEIKADKTSIMEKMRLYNAA